MDGRTARAGRTRSAIVEALITLISDGAERPTAQQIAAAAGVSQRSIFQHFADLEDLRAAVVERRREQVLAAAREVPDTGPLADRLAAFVAERAAVLEALAPFSRAAAGQTPLSPALQRSRADWAARSRASIERIFATELAARPPAGRRTLRCAVQATASVAFWEELRTTCGLGVPAARRALATTLAGLLSPGTR